MRQRWAMTAGLIGLALCLGTVGDATRAVAGMQVVALGRSVTPGGVWGTAQEVPCLAALNQGGPAEINSVSCAAPGHCSAGGYYHDSSGNQQVFVVNQR